jgi:HEAT repeat protein
LVWLLRKDDVWGRAHFILSYCGLHYPQVIPLLLHQAEQGPSPARPRAIEVLDSIGRKAQSAVPVLIRLLRDKDPWVRSRAARALGKIGDKAATPALLTTLTTDGNYDVRRRAATALGELGPNPDVVRALTQAIEDDRKLLQSLELTETRLDVLGNVHMGGSLSMIMEQMGLASRATEALQRIELGAAAKAGTK